MEENSSQLNNKDNTQVLRTYASDMADAVRNNEMSVIKIALAEQKKHEMEKVYQEENSLSVSKIIMIIGGIALIVGSIFGIYFLLQKKNAGTGSQQIIQNINTIISYDSESFIDVTNINDNSSFINLIKPEIIKPIAPGSIKSLFLTKNINNVNTFIQSQDFFSLMETTASSSLIKSFPNYMIGTYMPVNATNIGSQIIPAKPHLFLLFQTKDYNQSYAGMLAWEKTLLNDMFSIFSIDVSGNNNYLLSEDWKDIIINNKDARVLNDINGNPLLYYLAVDKDNFVITDNQDAIKEIISRLLTKNTKPL